MTGRWDCSLGAIRDALDDHGLRGPTTSASALAVVSLSAACVFLADQSGRDEKR
jgi:hypothetical protein